MYSNMIWCWEEEKGETDPTCSSKWQMNPCSCSGPVAVFVPLNVGHEHTLNDAPAFVEKHSGDN